MATQHQSAQQLTECIDHLMPTRYTLELEGLKGIISADTFKEVSQREDAKKNVKKTLEERYQSGKNRWFFTPLRKSAFWRGENGVLIVYRVLNRTTGLMVAAFLYSYAVQHWASVLAFGVKWHKASNGQI
jgi:hypothetical protein